jgi:hypothetical protein
MNSDHGTLRRSPNAGPGRYLCLLWDPGLASVRRRSSCMAPGDTQNLSQAVLKWDPKEWYRRQDCNWAVAVVDVTIPEPR